MPYKLYSRRQYEQKNTDPDVFIYDEVPIAFRIQFNNQINEILKALYSTYDDPSYKLKKMVNTIYFDEKGEDEGFLFYSDDGALKFLKQADTYDLLDFIDLWFYALRKQGYKKMHDAIENINYRFRFHNLGYEYANNELIRIDNKVLHQEAVKPAFILLANLKFSGANEEMRKAYEYRRTGDNKNAILEAGKAFESTLKVICTEKGYSFTASDTASKLLNILKESGFFPNYLNSHMDGINATLSSGLPTLRNRNGGHGQGQEVLYVPDSYVDYALHLLATNIVFLVGLL